jgi:hypothetical protein
MVRISACSSTILAEFLLGFLGTSSEILVSYVGNLPLLPSKSFRICYLAVALSLSLHGVILWAFQNIPKKMRFHLILSSRLGVTVTDGVFQ